MNVLGGFYRDGDGNPFSVEVPLTGVGIVDTTALMNAVMDLRPERKGVVKTGQAIEQRDAGLKVLTFPNGATVANLFLDPETGKEESSITIGTVTFAQEPCTVVLRFHRGRNAAGVTLKERRTGVPIKFGNVISGQRLAKELPALVKELIGEPARDLFLILKEVFPASA